MKILYKLFVLTFALYCGTKLAAQNSNTNVTKAIAKDNINWLKFKTNNLQVSTLFTDNKSAFGLGENDQMQLLKQETDQLGMIHYRFKQMYKSIPIDDADYLVHERNGAVISANGKLIHDLNLNTTPAISEKTAVETAIEYVNADFYLWEDMGAERMQKRITKDPNATFYPKAELVIAKDYKEEDGAYRLAYKVNVLASEPVSGQSIYIDALNGNVFGSLNLIHTTDVPGTAVTKYAGTQTIITDSVSPTLFRLREYTRGSGVETYNVAKATKYGSAVDFTDADNYWNNVNAAKDEVATDAHFGAEMTYDYFLQKHNRNSFDNQGTLLVSYIHFSNNYVNAFWNGSWMTYGDGNTSYSPLTPLDICGHELAHGVTSKSAGLIYLNESGALNESFSDIFGTAVEFFADSANANWLVAERIGTPFRSMSNPNLYSDPDTYKGTHYYNGSADEGGVHTNSGVQNFWFYLLSTGASGTNDKGNAFNVTSIGMEAAAKIAYRNLTVYLTKTSNHYDARQGAIWAAEDIYGFCSNEALQTANAWYAVGVGDPISDDDLSMLDFTSPSTACGLTSTENVGVQLRYNGCSSFAIGDTIPVAYKINNGTPVRDTIITVSALLPGDSINYTFTTPADLSVVGSYTIKAWLEIDTDTLNFNDSITIKVDNKLAQNIDVGITAINTPKNGCQLSANEALQVKLKFYGCDSLKANDSIEVAYRINGGSIETDTLVLSAPLYQNETIDFTFNKTVDLSSVDIYIIDTWTNYSKDTLNTNDSLKGYKINNPYLMDHKMITFEDKTNVVDSFYVATGSMAQAYISVAAVKNGINGFLMTGGNWFNNRKSYKSLNDMTTWSVNPEFSAKISFCVDARLWTTANLKFDMKQTYNTIYSNSRGYNYPYSSNLRLLVNGVQVGNTYNPVTKKADTYKPYFINLDAYAGTIFEVTFETKNYQSKSYDSDPSAAGDNAYLDNIYFSENSIVSVKENIEPTGNFEIYPNPGKDLFTVSYISKNPENITIELTDVLGKKIISQNRNVSPGNNTILLEIKDQQSGMYFISIRSQNNIGIKKLIVE
ncbi:MAG: M4 family metallopeptidase [Bacteroidota bacterium]